MIPGRFHVTFKLIKRQTYGRAGFALLRHRILLGLHHAPLPPKVSQSHLVDRPQHHVNAAGVPAAESMDVARVSASE